MDQPTNPANGTPLTALRRDLTAGVVVFLVALPLCLGIALASKAMSLSEQADVPLFAGLVAGIIGGIVVGLFSGSHTSVSGPAAGLTAVVAAQIAALGSFDAFLLAVMIAGLIQVVLGLARAGFLAAFFPTSVIKGLLAAIGIILILKQIPHLFGHDSDPEGEFRFFQPDHETTFSEIVQVLQGLGLHLGATVIGLASLAVLILWDKVKLLKKSPLPGPLVVVILGVALVAAFQRFGAPWAVGTAHLVDVPVATSLDGFLAFLRHPDWSQWNNPAVYLAAVTIAAVASLETLLNLEAVDKLDPKRRNSPASRELLAQGVGNTASGLLGGLPITAVIVRGSVNVNAGAQTKMSTIFHGVLLLVCVGLLPTWLNMIPLSALAAILLLTGFKLASPALFRRMWEEGKYQFLPFALTVAAIVLTDLLIGVMLGLGIAASFILWSNVRRPLHLIVEKHLGGEVVHIELANQVSFLNRAALSRALDEIPRGGHVLIDASDTDYIDPDVLDLIRDYEEKTGPARGVTVSLKGFRNKYQLGDRIQYMDYSTRELQEAVTPAQVLQILREGNERFRTGRLLSRDLGRQVAATAAGQHPLAVVLGCIDSRTPAELIFDVGVGDIFVTRIAGNVTSRKVIGSIEYAVAVAGAKLVVVMGHTRCGAVTAAVDLICAGKTAAQATGCEYIDHVIEDIQPSVDRDSCSTVPSLPPAEKEAFINTVARRNVLRAVERVRGESPALDRLVREGRVAIVGAMYDVTSGRIEFVTDTPTEPHLLTPTTAAPTPA
jgi:carbonic anhydrase/SulP family sulfate permease